MGEIAHHHDRFFKALLDQPGAAGALLREQLPAEVLQSLADDPAELVDGTFVDEELKESVSDRLYRLRTKDGAPLFVYCLVEHKSSPDGRIGLQLLRYLARIWDRLDKEAGGAGKLPPVVPLVLYHGEARWSSPPRFLGLVDGGERWASWLLDFPYLLVDIGRTADEELSRHAVLKAGLLQLKYAMRQAERAAKLHAIMVALYGALPEATPGFLSTGLVYIFHVYGRAFLAAVLQEVKRVMPEHEEEVDSIAALWKAEGRAAGKAEGMAQALLRQVQARFGEVPAARRQQILDADLDTLDRWLVSVLDAKDLDSLFSVH